MSDADDDMPDLERILSERICRVSGPCWDP